MAPKRRVKVVRAIKKVVEQTVEVLAVGSDSQSTVEAADGSESKYVEVVVEAKEDGVPVDVVITSATSADKQAGKGKELEREKRGGEEEERGGEQQSHPAAEKKAEGKAEEGKAGGLEEEKALDSIADKETQEEEKEAGLEEEGKAAEPRTPKKAERPPQMDQAQRKKRGRRKRYSGPGGGAGEMDGVGRGYKRYVFRVLKQVHPELGISARAMAVMDGLMGDMFERLADEAARLAAHARKATLSSREMQAAVRMVLPGELGKHAITEGNKAVSNYVTGHHGGGEK